MPKKFKFKGFEKDGTPIIRDNEGKRIPEMEDPPDFAGLDPILEVYKINPT